MKRERMTVSGNHIVRSRLNRVLQNTIASGIDFDLRNLVGWCDCFSNTRRL
jgi:hypothetical protein